MLFIAQQLKRVHFINKKNEESSVIAESLTCLHIAVQNGHREFVQFAMRTSQLRKLINMQDMDGKTALHYAVQQCDPRLLSCLLSHKDIDTTILDNCGTSAALQLSRIIDLDDETLEWKEMWMLMFRADPKDEGISMYNVYKGFKQRETIESRRRGGRRLKNTQATRPYWQSSL